MKLQLKRFRDRALVRPGAALILAAFMGTASAEPEAPRYTVGVIEDAAHGAEVLSERYDKAIARLERSRAHGIDRYYAATNLCVAYIKTGRFEDALQSCDDAVTYIANEIDAQSATFPRSRKAMAYAYNTFLAMALSNRGVAHAVTGAHDLARDDFKAALETKPRIHEATVNLARLASTSSPAV